ncbi:glycosyltransferase [Streptomyces sp. Je 1-4]|uniref:glycosyltransferase n=1 Tax=Streptomyces TaxID=1883 RepID=UPI0021DA92AF|nr:MULTISPECIES: glycosyltransferase [unclassified Streptomyces]UYB37963.1 glycosyltransferase [Streptomyces sp. Je 1-4]UZQ33892.1 glycosyltransferase [Streptomyces sp. Je 1-4] [Streptomyces sp. Je 1-4 4N24]UZQ41310.1 glycosyltransferase [Streptomyces sp. Je 1-4] [Streptomyces sp. Je 1-4 4N24_ara]
MRILITAHAIYSHLAPLVLPVAERAKEAGHEVAVATGAGVVEHIEKRGLTALTLPNVQSMGEALQGGTLRPPPGMEKAGSVTVELAPEFFASAFVGHLAEAGTRDLLEVARSWQPDLILHESTEYGGYLAAECLGIPHGALDIAPMAPYAHPVVTEELNRQRGKFGLAPVSDAWHTFRTFRAGVVPEDFYPTDSRLPSARYYQVPAQAAQGALDPDIAQLSTDRPLVLATLGSNATRLPGGAQALLETIVETLGELPVTGVVALGADRDPRQWDGPRSDNVHLTSFVQQELLLRSSDLFITHAGFNGTREALAAGVPMVAVPLFAEQSHNASRLQELGVGTRIDVQDVTRNSLAEAVRNVLEDRSYRSRAQGLQRRSHALPDLNRLVEDAAALTA